MKGLVMEVRDGFAAVFREDGAVVKIRQSCQVGETVELPELPQESAKNAWGALSAGVGALGAKLTALSTRKEQDTETPAPQSVPNVDPDATEIISDTVRDTLADQPPLSYDTTGVISNTVRDALDATQTDVTETSFGYADPAQTPFGGDDVTERPFDASGAAEPPLDNADTPQTPSDGADEVTELSFDYPAPEETRFDDTAPTDTGADTARDLFAQSSAFQIETDTGATTVISDTVRETLNRASGAAPEAVPKKKKSRKNPKTVFIPAALHVLDTLKDRVNTVKSTAAATDSAERKSGSHGKKAWTNQPWFRGAIAAALAIVILSGSFTYNTALACAYVSLDVDESSVEFSINRMGRVIAVSAISPDAQALAQTLQSGVKNKSVDAAVSYTMDVFKDAGYLDDANGEIIASVTSNTEKRSMELTQAVAETVEGSKSDGVKLYLMEASSGDRGAALARKVSPGRYLIQNSGMNTLRPRRNNDSSAISVSDIAPTPTAPETPSEPSSLLPTTVPDAVLRGGSSGVTPVNVEGLENTGSTTTTTPAASTDNAQTTNTTPSTPAAASPSTTTTTTPAGTTSGTAAPATTTPSTPATTTPTQPVTDSGNTSAPPSQNSGTTTTTNPAPNDSGRTTNPRVTNPISTPQPTQPTQPTRPTQSTQPTQPTRPTQSTQPTQTQPQPAAPSVQPETPPAQTVPSTPPATQPDTPPTPTVQPETPDVPPAQPENNPPSGPDAPSSHTPDNEPAPTTDNVPATQPDHTPENQPANEPENVPATQPETPSNNQPKPPAEMEPEELWGNANSTPARPSDGGQTSAPPAPAENQPGDSGETTGHVVRDNNRDDGESVNLGRPMEGETTGDVVRDNNRDDGESVNRGRPIEGETTGPVNRGNTEPDSNGLNSPDTESPNPVRNDDAQPSNPVRNGSAEPVSNSGDRTRAVSSDGTPGNHDAAPDNHTDSAQPADSLPASNGNNGNNVGYGNSEPAPPENQGVNGPSGPANNGPGAPSGNDLPPM